MQSLQQTILESLLDKKNKRVTDSIQGEKLRELAIEKCKGKNSNSSAYAEGECEIEVQGKEVNYHHDNDIKGPGYALWDAMMELGFRKISGWADHIGTSKNQKIIGIEFDIELDDSEIVTHGPVSFDTCIFNIPIKIAADEVTVKNTTFKGDTARLFADKANGDLKLDGNRYDCQTLFLRMGKAGKRPMSEFIKLCKNGSVAVTDIEKLVGGKVASNMARCRIRCGRTSILISKDPNWIPSSLEMRSGELTNSVQCKQWTIKAVKKVGMKYQSAL